MVGLLTMRRTVVFLGPDPMIAPGLQRVKKRRCDVLWVTDPLMLKALRFFKYRVLVFSDSPTYNLEEKAAAWILRFTADLVVSDQIKRYKRKTSAFDQEVADEIIDEVLNELRTPQD